MLRPTEPYAGNGTFLVGTVHATLERLVECFGPPQEDDDGDYGPGWTLEDDWGNIATVYGRDGCSPTSHVWHVGGHWHNGGHERAVWAHLLGQVVMEDSCPVCRRDWRERCDCETHDGNISPRARGSRDPRDPRGLATRCPKCGYDVCGCAHGAAQEGEGVVMATTKAVEISILSNEEAHVRVPGELATLRRGAEPVCWTGTVKGGAEQWAETLAQAFRRDGHRAVVIDRRPTPVLCREHGRDQ